MRAFPADSFACLGDTAVGKTAVEAGAVLVAGFAGAASLEASLAGAGFVSLSVAAAGAAAHSVLRNSFQVLPLSVPADFAA